MASAAYAQLELGRFEEALATANEAIRTVQRNDEGEVRARVARARALIALGSGEARAAVDALIADLHACAGALSPADASTFLQIPEHVEALALGSAPS